MEVRQEEDVLPARTVVKVVIAVVVIAIAFCLWAYYLLGAHEGDLRPSGRWPEHDLPQPTEVNQLEQGLFSDESDAAALRRHQRARLERWGWADRARGTITLPIDRAIDLYVARQQGENP
jgi:hypothetical protein